MLSEDEKLFRTSLTSSSGLRPVSGPKDWRDESFPRQAQTRNPRRLRLQSPSTARPIPTAPSSPPEAVNGTAGSPERRNSRCSCAIGRRYLFKIPGGAIAATHNTPGGPECLTVFFPRTPLPLGRSLSRKRKYGKPSTVRSFPAVRI